MRIPSSPALVGADFHNQAMVHDPAANAPGWRVSNGATGRIGLMGGDMQPQGHVQILLNLIDFGMNLQEAGDAPRLLHEGSSTPTGDVMTDGGTLALEPGFAPEVVAALRARGHRVEIRGGDVGFGGYQAIGVAKGGGWVGASESRKDGLAAGR